MPYMIVERDGEFCVYKRGDDGRPEGDALGCHDSREDAQAQIAAIWASERGEKGAWLSIEEMRRVCPSCAEKMERLGLKSINVLELKQMPEQLLRGLCDAIGNDPGFFTRCREGFSDWSDDPDAFCAWLHEQCLGMWPGEGRSVALKSEDGDTVTIAGWGVVFGGKDLEGETFTPETDFWLEEDATRPVLYEHGQQRDGGPGYTILGEARFEKRPEGLWVEAELDRHKEYVDEVLELVRRGALGWSTGSAGHLVIRENGRIIQWPIVEVSLTPTPAEPRTLGVREVACRVANFPALKSLFAEAVADTAQGGEGQEQDNVQKSEQSEVQSGGGTAMEERILEELKALGQRFDAVEQRLERLEGEPRTPPVGVVVQSAETKSFGDFLRSVARGDTSRLASVYGVKQMGTQPGSAGGYLVPTQYIAELFTVAGEASFVLPRTRQFRAHGPLVMPAIDLSQGEAGHPAWFGGMRMYWHEEGAALAGTDINMEQVQLQDHGLGGHVVVPNRLLSAAAVDVDATLRQMMGDAIAWYLDYYFLRGDGVGKPLGILNSPAVVAKVRNAANSFDVEDAAEMLARLLPVSYKNAVWLMNPTVLPQLVGFATGYTPVWMPDLTKGTPATLLGIPIVFTEKLPTLGTAGDVVLADFSFYGVLMPATAEIAVSEHYRFVYDQTVFRINVWVDGQPFVKSPATLADGSTTVSPFVYLQ